jgi:iron complex outermembrane recepter protein
MRQPATSTPRLTARSFVLTALALAATQSLAQTSSGAEVQTIEVTSRRVVERMIDVPLSIRALTGDDIEARGITSLTDLANFTPGLSYSPDLGRISERPVIRGISALRPEAPQPVSVFIDGVFLRDGALALVLDDAQRVEVIKGPQSALYGRATYAGAINYITVKPGDSFKGTASLTWAQAKEMSAFAALTVPLMKDKLTARIRAKHSEFGGQYTNTQTGNKIGDERTDAAGLTLRFAPTQNLDMLFALDRSDERDGLFNATVRTVPTQAGGVVTSMNGSSNVANGATCNGRVINIVGNNAVTGLPDATVAPTATNRLNGWPCGAATHTGTLVTRNELDLANYVDPVTGTVFGNIAGSVRSINRGAFTLNWEFGGGYTLTSQTAFTKQQANIGADQSYNGTRFAITGASWLSYDRQTLTYKSQELRLTSPEGGPWSWLVGVFAYDEDASNQTAGGVIARSGTNVVATAMRPATGSAVQNTSPFGRVQYEFSKALRMSLEGRYNKETVEAVGTPLGVATVTAGTCVAGQQCIVVGKKTFTDFSPRISLDYKPSRDMLTYAQFATGSKSGGFNVTAGLPAANFAYDGETVKSFEVGFKAVLAGGSVGLDAALFRNNIDGLQLSNISTVTSPFTGLASTTTIVNNVGKARTQGLEVSLSARLSKALTAGATYAFTDAKAIEGTEITNGTVFGGNTSVAGFTLPRTPKHSATVYLGLDTPIAQGINLTARADVIYQSRRYAEIQNMIWAEPFTRINLRSGLKGKGWKAELWVKNAANDDTSLNGFRYLDPVTFRRTAVDFLPKLRQVGLTGSIDF